MTKYAMQLTVRKIGNGYILNGAVQADNGGQKKLEELFYRTPSELDMGISTILSTAESVAADIKAQPASIFGSIVWGPTLGFGSTTDEDDDDDD